MRSANLSQYVPFYHLCERDNSLELYRENPKTKEIRLNFTLMIKKLVECEDEYEEKFPEANLKLDHMFTFNYIHPSTHYSCLHWLAYWNDSISIEMILNHIEKSVSKNSSEHDHEM